MGLNSKQDSIHKIEPKQEWICAIKPKELNPNRIGLTELNSKRIEPTELNLNGIKLTELNPNGTEPMELNSQKLTKMLTIWKIVKFKVGVNLEVFFFNKFILPDLNSVKRLPDSWLLGAVFRGFNRFQLRFLLWLPINSGKGSGSL